MKSLMLVGLLISNLSLAAVIVRVEKEQGVQMQSTCDIQISFGSYAGGIDHDAYGKISKLVEGGKEVTEAWLWTWGKEGERDLCLKMAAANRDKIYGQVKASISPASKKYWTELKAKGKNPFSTKGAAEAKSAVKPGANAHRK